MAIVVTRVRGGSRDQLRKYKLLVDGMPVGRIGQGETVRHEVPEGGEFTVQLKIDWGTSAAYRITLAPGESAYFCCAPGGDEAVYAVTEGRETYIRLQRLAGPVDAVEAPGPVRSRLTLALAVAFFGGGAMLVGGIIWNWTGVAKPAATVVASVGFLLTFGAMIVVRTADYRAAKRRRDSYDA